MFHILLVKGKKGSALEQNIQINSNMRIIFSSLILGVRYFLLLTLPNAVKGNTASIERSNCNIK
jgi:hypothetical protein